MLLSKIFITFIILDKNKADLSIKNRVKYSNYSEQKKNYVKKNVESKREDSKYNDFWKSVYDGPTELCFFNIFVYCVSF